MADSMVAILSDKLIKTGQKKIMEKRMKVIEKCKLEGTAGGHLVPLLQKLD